MSCTSKGILASVEVRVLAAVVIALTIAASRSSAGAPEDARRCRGCLELIRVWCLLFGFALLSRSVMDIAVSPELSIADESDALDLSNGRLRFRSRLRFPIQRWIYSRLCGWT